MTNDQIQYNEMKEKKTLRFILDISVHFIIYHIFVLSFCGSRDFDKNIWEYVAEHYFKDISSIKNLFINISIIIFLTISLLVTFYKNFNINYNKKLLDIIFFILLFSIIFVNFITNDQIQFADMITNVKSHIIPLIIFVFLYVVVRF